MASAIVVACPSCQKQAKAPAEAQGKKIRCKGCGEVFPIPGGAPAKAPNPPAAPPKPAPAAIKDDDDEGPQHYGVIKEEAAVPRCPHCAKELESAEAVICLNCGYNTVNRKRVGTKKTIERTAGDKFTWLLPGFLCIAGIIVVILFDLFFCLIYPMLIDKDSEWLFTTANGLKVWEVVASLFAMFYLGRFAYQRLVLHPEPPEIEKR
jgi:hypothetical protein